MGAILFSMKNTHYCEDCLEEFADEDIIWEEGRACCGQCGSDLSLVGDEPDLVDVLSSRRLRPLLSTDDDDGEDEEDGSDPEHSAP